MSRASAEKDPTRWRCPDCGRLQTTPMAEAFQCGHEPPWIRAEREKEEAIKAAAIRQAGRGRRPPPITHGTTSGYNYHGCRCDLCRAEMRRYKQGKKALKAIRAA